MLDLLLSKFSISFIISHYFIRIFDFMNLLLKIYFSIVSQFSCFRIDLILLIHSFKLFVHLFIFSPKFFSPYVQNPCLYLFILSVLLVLSVYQVLYLTEPDRWSAAAVYQATRIFTSNLNAKMAQRWAFDFKLSLSTEGLFKIMVL